MHAAEREMFAEMQIYEQRRREADVALQMLLSRAEMSPEDERTMLRAQAALVAADVARVIGDPDADPEQTLHGLTWLSRELIARRDPLIAGERRRRAALEEDVQAAWDLLAELREAREKAVSVLWDAIDRAPSDEDVRRAAQECVPLLQEQRDLLSAVGDLEGAARASTLLTTTQRRLEESGPKYFDTMASDIVATLVPGRIPVADRPFAQRVAAEYLRQGGGAVRDGEVEEHVVSQYREVHRRTAATRDTGDVIPKNTLVGT